MLTRARWIVLLKRCSLLPYESTAKSWGPHLWGSDLVVYSPTHQKNWAGDWGISSPQSLNKPALGVSAISERQPAKRTPEGPAGGEASRPCLFSNQESTI